MNVKGYLSIGELAKLLNVSTHQIRYFEEQGVLKPDEIGENGYRMYGINSLYRMSHILYLREFAIPVSRIKECFESYKEEDYILLFKEKIEELNIELKRLTTLRDETVDMVSSLEKIHNRDSVFSTIEREERIMAVVIDETLNQPYTVKEFYRDFKGVKDLYKTDFATYIKDSSVYSCVECESEALKEKDKKVLPQGKYLNYLFTVKEESEVDEFLKKFYRHIYINDIDVDNYLIIMDNTRLSIAKNKEMYYQIEARIKEKNK